MEKEIIMKIIKNKKKLVIPLMEMEKMKIKQKRLIIKIMLM